MCRVSVYAYVCVHVCVRERVCVREYLSERVWVFILLSFDLHLSSPSIDKPWTQAYPYWTNSNAEKCTTVYINCYYKEEADKLNNRSVD